MWCTSQKKFPMAIMAERMMRTASFPRLSVLDPKRTLAKLSGKVCHMQHFWSMLSVWGVGRMREEE